MTGGVGVDSVLLPPPGSTFLGGSFVEQPRIIYIFGYISLSRNGSGFALGHTCSHPCRTCHTSDNNRLDESVILVTGFVVIPLSTPPGAVSLEASGATPLISPGHPGEVGANLLLTVNNQDPIPHSFLFVASVSNVSALSSSNTTTNLSGAALASWEANATWQFSLPDGRVVALQGGLVSFPESDYVTVNATGGHTLSLTVRLTDTDTSENAVGAGLAFTTNMLCAPSGGGSASTTLSVSFA